jgi:hypothetical protein
MPIARSLFSKGSKITVNSEAEYVDLSEQARANKALARILPYTEGGNSSIQEKLGYARREQEKRLREGLKLLDTTQEICQGLGIPYVVIKSLDALPDLGHDIDLLVGKNLVRVRDELLKRLRCSPVTLTFCDRQAGKFSTFIEGYDFDFELYARITQMGEEYYPEETVLQNRNYMPAINGGTYLCSNEDRLLITCIHTMYRHQKIRLSDLNIAFEAFRQDLDLQRVLQTVESAGIQKGFAVFMSVLRKTAQNSTGKNILPREVDAYIENTLYSDPVIARMTRRLKDSFPLKIPLALSICLFLYKAWADASKTRLNSFLRSLAAPVLLVMDKSVPYGIQKRMSVRIW